MLSKKIVNYLKRKAEVRQNLSKTGFATKFRITQLFSNNFSIEQEKANNYKIEVHRTKTH